MAVKAKSGKARAKSGKAKSKQIQSQNRMVKQSIISGRILDYESGADDEVSSDAESMRWICKYCY